MRPMHWFWKLLWMVFVNVALVYAWLGRGGRFPLVIALAAVGWLLSYVKWAERKQ